MKVIIAGIDQTDLVGRQLQAEGAALAARHPVNLCAPQHSALLLRESGGRSDYVARLLRLLRIGSGLHTILTTPPKPRKGVLVKIAVKVKRRIMRYFAFEHDYLVHQQTMHNEMMATAMEYMRADNEACRTEMEKKIAALEARLAAKD